MGEAMTSVLVVIPTYNESESIESLLKRLNSARMQISDKFEIDILIVDDNSPDKTASLIDSKIANSKDSFTSSFDQLFF